MRHRVVQRLTLDLEVFSQLLLELLGELFGVVSVLRMSVVLSAVGHSLSLLDTLMQSEVYVHKSTKCKPLAVVLAART